MSVEKGPTDIIPTTFREIIENCMPVLQEYEVVALVARAPA